MNQQTSFPSDSELLHAIKTGDERTRQEAKNKLVAKHNEKLTESIVGYLRWKKCNQPAIHGKGVLNHTWINGFSNLDDVHEPEKFRAWLIAVGHNVANRHLKSCIGDQNSSVEFTEDPLKPPAQIADYYSSKDAAIDADRMLTYAYNISEEFGSIFRLYNEEELEFDEIARRLGKSKEAIRTQYYRGFRKVRAKFNKKDQ